MSIPLHLRRTQAGVTVSVHPVVPLIVCDAFTRRNSNTRVLGTILGSLSENEYRVTNCFVVPHTETGTTVAIDTSHHQTLLDLHQKVYPKEVVLGWFSSTHSPQSVDSLIQQFYSSIVPNPLRLAIDAALEYKDDVKVTAQVSRSLFLKGMHVATEFVEVACRVKMEHVKSIGLHLLQNETTKRINSSSENMLATVRKLIDLVNEIHSYTESVVDGSRKGDAVIGRYLSDTLAIIPFINREKFKSMLKDRLQEMTLVVYLSSLCKAQIAISDKLAMTQV